MLIQGNYLATDEHRSTQIERIMNVQGINSIQHNFISDQTTIFQKYENTKGCRHLCLSVAK